jgi:hypothetical protein
LRTPVLWWDDEAALQLLGRINGATTTRIPPVLPDRLRSIGHYFTVRSFSAPFKSHSCTHRTPTTATMLRFSKIATAGVRLGGVITLPGRRLHGLGIVRHAATRSRAFGTMHASTSAGTARIGPTGQKKAESSDARATDATVQPISDGQSGPGGSAIVSDGRTKDVPEPVQDGQNGGGGSAFAPPAATVVGSAE